MIFRRPQNMQELALVLSLREDGRRIAAGCTDILPQKLGKSWEAAGIRSLLDITAVEELKQIRLQPAEDGGTDLLIGAACTHAQIAEDLIVQQHFPALAQACGGVGSVQIRNRGTIGGNIANASPAADTVPPLMAFGASALLLNGSGALRGVPLDALIEGPGRLTLEKDECIAYLRCALPKEGARVVSAFAKLGDRDAVTIARISLAVCAGLEEGALRDVRCVLGATGRKAFRSIRGEHALEGAPADALAGLAECFADALAEDIAASIPGRGTLAYKRLAVRGVACEVLNRLI